MHERALSALKMTNYTVEDMNVLESLMSCAHGLDDQARSFQVFSYQIYLLWFSFPNEYERSVCLGSLVFVSFVLQSLCPSCLLASQICAFRLDLPAQLL